MKRLKASAGIKQTEKSHWKLKVPPWTDMFLTSVERMLTRDRKPNQWSMRKLPVEQWIHCSISEPSRGRSMIKDHDVTTERGVSGHLMADVMGCVVHTCSHVRSVLTRCTCRSRPDFITKDSSPASSCWTLLVEIWDAALTENSLYLNSVTRCLLWEGVKESLELAESLCLQSSCRFSQTQRSAG